ncbi:hypothetical protein AB205_0211180 [Aquarana catesbeiana]|uniref:Secreted protein n=1 Tax=Aquarana catesbeiana TaxID=8400 RepID=A0A2G9SHG7_AQUCT|nr:hypothetical protein AB205_0211180 [Aquarana catesbeiana]
MEVYTPVRFLFFFFVMRSMAEISLHFLSNSQTATKIQPINCNGAYAAHRLVNKRHAFVNKNKLSVIYASCMQMLILHIVQKENVRIRLRA